MRGKLRLPLTWHRCVRNIPAYAGKTWAPSPIMRRTPEHPRVCGENVSNAKRWARSSGTSPRMRGKLADWTCANFGDRNIPAYAGKTFKSAWSPSTSSEHPRVCGENGVQTVAMPPRVGTSPRMRGKRPRVPSSSRRQRNIPAYAGKTQNPWSGSPQIPEHPRVCGENPSSSLFTVYLTGTSPRMRGKQPLAARSLCRPRNIPAYAGKTMRLSHGDDIVSEHPRVCGENPVLVRWNSSQTGTSPRMRGKLNHGGTVRQRNRNIPAYAGKTHRSLRRLRRRSEHPRVCGENRSVSRRFASFAGTSPRMRGKPQRQPAVRLIRRNIPAYAGKTSFPGKQAGAAPEHPRVCGENPSRVAATRPTQGTSPRMRGKPAAGC